MLYEQKRVAARATFAFGEKELNYSFRYDRSEHEAIVDYIDIEKDRKHVAQRDWSRFHLGLLLLAAGLIALGAQTVVAGASALSALWILPGAAVLAIFAFSQGHFVALHAGNTPVWIIDDKSRHDVIAEIDRRRRDRIAELYGPLNLANEPYLEIRKIEWLVLESVLTRETADRQISMIEAHAASKAAAAEEAEENYASSLFAREALAI